MGTTMVRKQIYIPRRQDVLLKRLSETRGVSEAEVIRQAIENEISREMPSDALDTKSALDLIMEFVDQRIAAAEPGEPYRWNREEIYEERAARWIKQGTPDE
jgi:Arc/MetJ-type ribon-helix-helix transcriptional regulator